MAVTKYKAEEFYGIDQSRDGAFVNEGTSPDARNMDTVDGNLSVAKGFVKHFDLPIPGSGAVKRLFIMKLFHELQFLAVAKNDEGILCIYAYREKAIPIPPPEEGEGAVAQMEGGDSGVFVPYWDEIFRYPESVGGNHIDAVQCNIGNYDFILIACGEHSIVKWDGASEKASVFGSGEYVLETTVQSYASSQKKVTLVDAIDEIAKKRLMEAGIVINGVTHDVASVDEVTKSVVLSSTPSPVPTASHEVKVRGGNSDAPVNYLALHFSRLFAAGDPEHPNRLYYSQIAGDSRGIEDWSSDEVSSNVNASGGFIEVGDSVGDPIMGIASLSTQLLILKRYSVYRLMGDRPSYYTVERIDAEVEQTSHTSIVRYADMAYFFTPVGLRYFNNVTVSQVPDAKNIQHFMKASKVSLSKGCTAKDMLYFTCYHGSGGEDREYDNAIVTYDIRRRSYMVRDGFRVSDILAVDGVIYMVNDNRYVYRFNEGEDYDGGAIRAYWETPVTDWQERFKEKRVCEVALRGEGEGNTIIFTTRYGAKTHVYRTLMKENTVDILEIEPHVDWARTFGFRIENEAGSRFSLHGGLEAYIEVKERPR